MINALIRSARIEHSIILDLGVFVILKILGIMVPQEYLLSLLAVPFLISAGAFILNDYYDIESDRINHKNTPLVKGDINPRIAYFFGVIFLGIGVIAALPLGLIGTIIAILFAGLSWMYDFKLKDLPLVGNIVIALSMSIVFIFTEASLLGTISYPTLILATIAFLFGLGREIIKTVQDMEGDAKARKSKTLPMIIGPTLSIILAVILITFAGALNLWMYYSVYPFILASVNSLRLMWISEIIIAIAVYSVMGMKMEGFELSRKLTLIGMAGILISYLIL